jgi:putative polyketide hydroxylase
MPVRQVDTPVLIVGGGPAGLCASLLLSRQGVRSLVIEQRPCTSVHPKTRGLNARTLELFRVWGIEPAVRATANEVNDAMDVVWAPTFVARNHASAHQLPMRRGAGSSTDTTAT